VEETTRGSNPAREPGCETKACFSQAGADNPWRALPHLVAFHSGVTGLPEHLCSRVRAADAPTGAYQTL